MNKDQRREYIREYYSNTPNSTLAQHLNITPNAVKKIAQRLGIKKDPLYGTINVEHNPKEGAMAKRTLKADREALKREESIRTTVKNYKEALKRIDELELHLDAQKKIANNKRTHIIKPHKSRNNDEATAVACLSDVHIGEKVSLEQTNGLNEYSMDIAKKRLDMFFSRIVKLTDKERQDVEINTLVLFLGGDIIDGALHMDTIMHNEVSEPINQAITAQAWIRAGLNHLAQHFTHIKVICKDGNHGRITQRIHHASRAGNSLEWYMYDNLAREFPQFEWINERSLHTYVTFYPGSEGQKIVRFHHGDTISFGGVNGPYTYLNRRRYQWNAGRRADIDVIGHLHSYRVNPNGWILNGSVVGYNPFAISLGAEFERPQQAFFLMDKKRGMTVNIPILFM